MSLENQVSLRDLTRSNPVKRVKSTWCHFQKKQYYMNGLHIHSANTGSVFKFNHSKTLAHYWVWWCTQMFHHWPISSYLLLFMSSKIFFFQNTDAWKHWSRKTLRLVGRQRKAGKSEVTAEAALHGSSVLCLLLWTAGCVASLTDTCRNWGEKPGWERGAWHLGGLHSLCQGAGRTEGENQ